MADGVWKDVYPQIFGQSNQLSLNKFFDPSTPSMKKGRNGGEKRGKTGGERKKRMMKIVATNVMTVGPTGIPIVHANSICVFPA